MCAKCCCHRPGRGSQSYVESEEKLGATSQLQGQQEKQRQNISLKRQNVAAAKTTRFTTPIFHHSSSPSSSSPVTCKHSQRTTTHKNVGVFGIVSGFFSSVVSSFASLLWVFSQLALRCIISLSLSHVFFVEGSLFRRQLSARHSFWCRFHRGDCEEICSFWISGILFRFFFLFVTRRIGRQENFF